MSITITKLNKSYGSLVVFQNLDLTLEEPGCHCLMAASGWGKTTLFRILAGLEPYDSGTIDGIAGRRISFVFQEDRLLEHLSVLDNIALTASQNHSRQQLMEQASILLPQHSLLKPVASLSGGQKRRVAILRALLSPFDLLLMDEPFTGLDVDTKDQVSQYIKKKTEQKLVLFSSHQKEEADLLDSRIILARLINSKNKFH